MCLVTSPLDWPWKRPQNENNSGEKKSGEKNSGEKKLGEKKLGEKKSGEKNLGEWSFRWKFTSRKKIRWMVI